MRSTNSRFFDPALAVAVALLVAVLGWRAALTDFASAPPRVDALFTATPGDSGRLVLVIDRTARADSAVRHVRRSQPHRVLDVDRVPWPAPADRRSRPARIAALIRAYGHTELPVLLTLTSEGLVARVQSLADKDP